MNKTIKRFFGYTAYTWDHPYTNGYSKESVSKTMPIKAIESLRGKISKIGFSKKHALAITDNGKIYSWGDKKDGKLGLSGNPPQKVIEPTEISFFSKNNISVKDFALSKNKSLILTSSDQVYSFGRGAYSSSFLINLLFASHIGLGHPTATSTTKPKLIEKLAKSTTKQISCGNHFSLFLTEPNTLMACGRGEFGVFGCKNKESGEPFENEVMSGICESLKAKIVKIKSCEDFSSVLLDNGQVFSFGNNSEGVMGIGKGMRFDFWEIVNTPTPVDFLEKTGKIVDFDLSENTMVLLMENGTLYQCGQKTYFNPELINLDYNTMKVKSFCAMDRGVGIITTDNEVIVSGHKFWPLKKELKPFGKDGLQIVQTKNAIGDVEIVEIGNRYGEDCYILVKDK